MKKLLFLLFTITTFAANAQIQIDYFIREGVTDIIESRYHSAIRRFNTIIDIKPQYWQAYYLRGIAKISLGDEFGAEQDFNTGMDINPFFSEFYLYKGMLRKKEGDFSSADSLFSKALEMDPSNPFIYLKKCEYQMGQENFEEALKLADRATIMSSSYGDAYLYKAFCHAELKQYDKALENFSKAIEVNSFDERVFTWRGRLFIMMEDYSSALADFNISLLLNDKDPLVYYFRSIAHYENGNYEACLKDLDKVLDLNPSNSYAYYNRAIVYSEIGNFNEAMNDYESLLNLEPDYLLAHFNKGILHLEMKQYAEAIQAFNSSIKIFNEFYYAYMNRAIAKHNLGDIGGAIQDQMTADKIKKEFEESDYADSTKFKELIMLDGNFAYESTDDRFSIRTLKQNKSGSVAVPNYYFSPPCEDSLAHIYTPLESIASKKYASELEMTNQPCDSVGMVKDIESMAIRRSLLLADADNYNSAISILDSILLFDPTDAVALTNRAWIRMRMVDFMKSLEELPQNTMISSKTFNFTMNMESEQKTTYEDYYVILDDLNKIDKAYPNEPHIAFNKGNAYLNLYKYPEAIASYKKAIDLKNDFGEAYFNTGLAYIYIEDEQSACYNLSKAGENGVKKAYTLIKKYCK